MAIINVENLTFTYPGQYEPVFEDVSFQIDTNWKLGFIGRNGRGKTTFLNLLLGKYEYDGVITYGVTFDYFPYPVNDPERMTYDIFEDICPDAQDWERMRELSLLEVDDDVLWRSFDTLSHGEQTKVLLAALFLNEGRFLLLDEPTNHLDTHARQVLAAYLKKKKSFILVSHDRDFLDGCVDHILSLNRSGIQVQSGNFSTWWENYTRQQDFELARNEHLKKDIDRLKQSARRTADWSDKVESTKTGGAGCSGLRPDRGFVGHKAAKMMKRSKSLQARQEAAIEEKSQLLADLERCGDLKLVKLDWRTRQLADFFQVSPSYDGRTVCSPVTFTLEQGERIALSGRNGSGKSTLLKLLLGQEVAHTGLVTVGSGLVISHVPQNAEFLRGSLSDYAEQLGVELSLLNAMLHKLGLEREQFDADMADFSAGQKKKVLIAGGLCQRAHLYVWDEPLNYIDIFSRMQIEALVKRFSPTMVFVEHDRAFQQNIATKVVEL